MDPNDDLAPEPILELEELRAQLAESDEALVAARAAHDHAVARLREALLATEPTLDPALVAGETVEDVEASFAAAQETLARVREAVRREAAAAIPAGTALRQSGQGAMTPLDKIRAGLARR